MNALFRLACTPLADLHRAARAEAALPTGFNGRHTRRALRFLRRHPELKAQYTKALALLEANPHHPSLRLHALTRRMAGLHSVSINLSYRITLELLIQNQQIIPINVGDYDKVC